MARAGGKERIVDAAASLFSDRGYHATGIRDIAEGSGMLSGSLYAHIKSKEDLLYEIVRRVGDQFVSTLEPIAGDVGMAPEDRLREAMRGHIRTVAASIRDARIFLTEWRSLTGPRLDEIAAMRDHYENLWDRVLGAFPRHGRNLARLMILSAANGVYQWYDPAGSLDPDQVADSFTDLLLDGLRAPSRRKMTSTTSQGATR